MIPYESVRAHLERHHWIATRGVSWPGLVAIHEQEHRTHSGDPHRPAPATASEWAELANPATIRDAP